MFQLNKIKAIQLSELFFVTERTVVCTIAKCLNSECNHQARKYEILKVTVIRILYLQLKWKRHLPYKFMSFYFCIVVLNST
jgi:hypothetical protein